MYRIFAGTVLAAAVVLGGCAQHTQVKPTQTIILPVDGADKAAADGDLQKVYDGLAMIREGHIQAAIDGPLTEVIDAYEAKYKDKPVKVFCARGTSDAFVYAAIGAEAIDRSPGVSVEVIGPAWALAYWARGYAYTEMARYADARVELEKALALSPMDSQYKSELAFNYQHSRDWDKMLSLYQEAEADADFGAAPEHITELKCAALRGQGYALVELHRLDEATKAYQGCLKLTPGEPKSLAELKYIQGLRAKGDPSAGASRRP